MSSRARNEEKRKLREVETERLHNELVERQFYFSELVSKLDELGIDARLLKEYLDYIY